MSHLLSALRALVPFPVQQFRARETFGRASGGVGRPAPNRRESQPEAALASSARRGRFVLSAAIILCRFAVCAASEPTSSNVEMLGDAELHDVLFLDTDRGWAVGDRGVIWETESGGRSWRLRDSPTTARLRGIHFINERLGWIVGGWIHPYTHRSSAVLLRTEDGGKKWTRVDVPTLPTLRHVFFTDARHGWAFGDSSPLYAAGLFRTKDGGYTWESLPGIPARSFLSGAFVDSRQGFLLASDSSGWSLMNGQLTSNSASHAQGLRGRAVRFSGVKGWLVGEAGTVLTSDDAGGTWSLAPGKLPEGAASEFDWRAVAARDRHCWIAGSPGTSILHSPDGGRSWRMSRTGQTLPVNQLFFLDDQHGWSVGPLGRILSTRDGGQTWRLQRSGGERLGLLALPSRAERLSLELLAKTAADEGRFAAVAALWRPEQKNIGTDGTVEERLRDACSAVGAITAQIISPIDRQPAPSLMHDAPRQSDGSLTSAEISTEEGTRQVVRQLRMWRPDVVMTESFSSEGNSEENMTVQAVLRAVQQAADPAVFPDQIVLAGLQPWSTRKVVGVVRPNEHASVNVDTSRLSMQLGSSLADYTAAGRGLISDNWGEAPRSIGYRLLWSQASQELATRDLFSGVPPTSAGETRRSTLAPPAAQLEGLSRSAQQLRNLHEIAARGVGGDRNHAAILPQIEQLMQGQEPAVAGRMLHRLAEQFLAAGRYSAAADCFVALVDRFPDHALSDAALLWLVRYDSSAEMQWAFGPRRLRRLPMTSPTTADSSAAPLSSPHPALAVQNASFVLPTPTSAPTRRTAPIATREGSARLGSLVEQIRRTRPALFADSRVQFPLAADLRRTGKTADALQLWRALSSSQLAPEWRAVARTEQLRLERGSIRPPVSCVWSQRKPRLDGVLDDACWQAASRIRVPATASVPATEVLFAHDEEFFYLALHCFLPAERQIERPAEPRVRDASLLAYDRVELALDVDRDYHTCFELTIDERGWTNEACAGDLRWNPQWFVATNAIPTSTSEVAWIVEAALPLSEVGVSIQTDDPLWCFRLRRTSPNGSLQVWPPSSESGLNVAEFSLLELAPMAPDRPPRQSDPRGP